MVSSRKEPHDSSEVVGQPHGYTSHSKESFSSDRASVDRLDIG